MCLTGEVWYMCKKLDQIDTNAKFDSKLETIKSGLLLDCGCLQQ
ncbi:hypothetical protein EGR_06532 [Echinococcus granulosus]|uniref:Uncharacterized protein n=1 Tax=Echinococcus granulosus TaxID=6210 RepID=W6UYJ9_ECHGR|nr:hypothetical protein EGR_06532 [Echinococcus granulosus]EUB58649.1 hypothetical protein EGR_06532 [Echinococcus granulosus]